MNWRHEDERMGVFKCDDNPFHEAYRYFFRPLRTLSKKMLDNRGPGRATVSFKTQGLSMQVKYIYSEKGTKFCELFTLLLPCLVPVKSKVEISQNFVAFSEYMNFITLQ